MIFILLILSLQLTSEEDVESQSEEEIKKTLFAEDPLEVFVAGKLEIANSHTAMTQDEIQDLYLEKGENYFQVENSENSSNTKVPEGASPDEKNEAQDNDSPKQEGNDQTKQPEPEQEPVISSGDPQVDEALSSAFKWLDGQQNIDGSWDKSHQYGITGLVVLAHLTYKKKTHSTEFDKALNKGIEFLVNDDKCKPGIPQFAYQNAIKTFALAEAAGLLGNSPELEKSAKESIQYIFDGQQEKGGFAYKYNVKNKTQDLSLTAWNLQALNSSDKIFNIPEARQGIEKALPWLAAMAKENFTYNTKNHLPSKNPDKEPKNQSMRAIGTWLTILLDSENRDNVQDELKVIATENYENLSWSTKNGHPFYGWYYANLCMTDLGGKEGDKWRTKLRNLMVYNQQKAGYWRPIKYKHGSVPIYSTAFCALMLVSGHKDAEVPTNKPPRTGGDSDVANLPASTPVAKKPSDTSSSADKPSPFDKPVDVTEVTAETTSLPDKSVDASKLPSVDLEKVEPDDGGQDFETLISLDKNKAAEIKKRLSVFRRSIKSDSSVRAELAKEDLNSLNNSIVKFLNRKYFLEAQLNKMNEDPFIHGESVLKDRYVYLNKEVTSLMKKIDEYENSNSEDLVLNPIKIYLDSKEFNIRLHDGENLRFSSSVDGIKGFKAWLQGKDVLKDVLLIAIKPSGVKNYREVENFIRYLNFKTSVKPVDENMEAN